MTPTFIIGAQTLVTTSPVVTPRPGARDLVREMRRLGEVLVNLPMVRETRDPVAMDVAHALGIPLDEFRLWNGPARVSQQIRQMWQNIEGKMTYDEFKAILEVPETYGYLEFAEQGAFIVHVDQAPSPSTTRVLEMVKGKSITIPPWNYPKNHGDFRAWPNMTEGFQKAALNGNNRLVIWDEQGTVRILGLPGSPSIPSYEGNPARLRWCADQEGDSKYVKYLEPIPVFDLLLPFQSKDMGEAALGLSPITKAKEKPDVRPTIDYLGGAPYPPPIDDGDW